MSDTPQNRKQRRSAVMTSEEFYAALPLALAGRLNRPKIRRRVGKLPRPDDPRRLAAIERGLDLLLRSYLRVRDKPPRCPVWVEELDDDFHEYTREGGFHVYDGLHSSVHYPEEYELILDLMGENPVRAALRHAIRLLGQQVFDLTKSEDGMRETLERVADLDPSCAGEREVVMDKNWSGIGGWYA
jgi:hypothetical protein